MGWLRDFVETSTLGSFDSLAKASLKHPAWPRDVTLQPRSLGALLGKLDRGEELEWLASRPEVQGILAETLGAPFSEVQRALPQPAHTAPRWSWRDAPRAASLELLREPLPPGFPREVLAFGHPGGHGKGALLVWTARAGSGRSLAGRWLELNQRASRVDLDENLSVSVPQDSLFIEVPQPDAATLYRLAQFLSKLSSKTNVLIASPVTLAELQKQGSVWQNFVGIEHATTSADINLVVAWLLRRLPSDSVLALAHVQDFVSKVFADRPWSTFGDILSLCGTLDEVAGDGRLSLERLQLNLLQHRLQRIPGDPLLPWLKKHVTSALLGLFEQLLSHSTAAWEQPRSIDAWSALVPAEFQHVVDLNWLKRTLPEADTHIRVRDVERAAKRLSPGAFQVVLGLQRLGFLSDDGTGSGQLQFAPRWLGLHLFESILSASVNAASPVLGSALLGEHAAEVATRIAFGFTSERVDLDHLSERVYDGSAAAIAAFEMTFRLTGLALLRGVDFEAEQLTELWDEQFSTLIEPTSELPGPAVNFPHSQVLREPLLSSGFFIIAALAVTERVLRSASPHPLLNPWKTSERAPKLGAALDDIAIFIDAAEGAGGSAWLSEVYLLLHRLQIIADRSNDFRSHRVFAAARVIDSCIAGTLAWSDLHVLAPQAHTVATLQRFAEDRCVWSKISEACWAAYQHALFPDDMGILAPNHTWADAFWLHLPAPLAIRLLQQRKPVRLTGVEDGWSEIIAQAAEHLTPELCACIPVHIVEATLRRFELVPLELWTALWPAHESICRSYCVELLERGETRRGVEFLLTAPNQVCVRLLQPLALTPELLIPLPQGLIDRLMIRLHACVRERTPEFGIALELLLSLKQARQLFGGR